MFARPRVPRHGIVAMAAAGAVFAPFAASATTEPAATVEGDIVVFAAASLTDAFTALGDAFASEHPDAGVTLNFAASSDLVNQINEGAPADVYASADEHNMSKLVDAGRNAGDPETFATNSLAIAVEPGNPLGVTGVESLADPELITLTCDPEVPIGRYTQQVFDAADVSVEPDSFEESVRGILTKVIEGEADAGVVYATDVTAAGDDVAGVAIPAGINVIARYPIAAVADAPNTPGADAFIAFVLGEAGQDVLAEFGFGPIDAAAEPAMPSSTTDTTAA